MMQMQISPADAVTLIIVVNDVPLSVSINWDDMVWIDSVVFAVLVVNVVTLQYGPFHFPEQVQILLKQSNVPPLKQGAEHSIFISL